MMNRKKNSRLFAFLVASVSWIFFVFNHFFDSYGSIWIFDKPVVLLFRYENVVHFNTYDMAAKSKNKKTSSTRKRKGNACTFCGKVIIKIGDHLQQQHADENVIKEISKLKNLQEKRKQLGFLISQGNFKHNEKALSENNGAQIIPKYLKRNKIETTAHLTPCQKCGSYSTNSFLKKHRCPTSRHLTVNLSRIDIAQAKTNTTAEHAQQSSFVTNSSSNQQEILVFDLDEINDKSSQLEISSRVENEKSDVKLPRCKPMEPKYAEISSLEEDTNDKTSNSNQQENFPIPSTEFHDVLDLDKMNDKNRQLEISSRIENKESGVKLPRSKPIGTKYAEISSLEEDTNVKIDRLKISLREPTKSVCAELSETILDPPSLTMERKTNVYESEIYATKLKESKSELPVKIKTSNLNGDVPKTNSTNLDKLKTEILDSLRDDEITEIILKDNMILTFGKERLQGVSPATVNNNYVGAVDHIRQIMRRAGNYLYHFRKVVGDPELTLEDSFKKQDQYHEKLPEIGIRLSKNYSHPFNISNTRTALGNILKVFKRKQFNDEAFNMWRNIKERFEESWQSLNEQARTGKRLLSQRKKIRFPSNSDYKRLLDHLEKNLSKYIMKKKITKYNEYLQLCRLVLTKVTLFNHRRSGEVARMTIEEYERRDKEPLDIKEYKDQLSDLEIALAKSVDIVTLKGKSAKNELVIAILLPECQAAVQKVLECKKQFSFLRQNKFVFAIRGNRKHYLSGNKAIKKIVAESKVKNVHVFTAGLIRKTICTKMIWMNLDHLTRKLLISQLGHLPSIHENIYEEHMRSGLGQFTKLPAALLKYNAEYKGIKNDDDTLIENLKTYSDRLGDQLDECQSNAENSKSDESSDSEASEPGTDTEDESVGSILAKPQRSSIRLRSCSQKIKYAFSSDSERESIESSDSNYEYGSKKKKKYLRKRAKKRIQVKWNIEMKKMLKETFFVELQNKDLPVRSKKLLEFRLRIAKEVGKTISTSSIKTKLHNIRHGKDKLEIEQ